jgi:nicotinamide-nucleotide amidase
MASPLAAALTRAVGRAGEAGLTLATVESCTAGRLSAALAGEEGGGRVLHGGFVVYSKPQKVALGVSADLINDHTAVSSEVAEAMARAALVHSPADVTLAITGVAGPEPDEDGNPVGLVYVAAARRAGGAMVQRLMVRGGQEEICAAAMAAALDLAVTMIGKAGLSDPVTSAAHGTISR